MYLPAICRSFSIERSNSPQPAASASARRARSSDSATCPARISARSDSGPRKNACANNSISRTLKFRPLTATMNSSMSLFETPFMRINWRIVYM